MKELTHHELEEIQGGTVSNDTVYAVALATSGIVFGALLTIATGGAAAPVFAVWMLGILGTGANGVAITMAL